MRRRWRHVLRKPEAGMVVWGTRTVMASIGACVVMGGMLSAQVRPSWSRKDVMPFERAEIAVAAWQDKVYVISGQSRGVEANAFNWEYDLKSGMWRELALMPSVASHAGAVALDGKVYVIGGFVANVHVGAVDRVFEYTIATDSWRALAPLSAPRGAPGVVLFNGKIHAIGGRDVERNTVATHEIYDPATNTWRAAAPLPVARDHLGVVVFNGKIHAFGGRLGATANPTGQHDVYDPATDTWSQGPPLRTPRSAGVGFVAKGRIIYAGGECKDPKTSTTFNEVEAYDPATNRWDPITALGAGRHAAGAVVAGVEAYVLGGNIGCGGNKPTTEVLAFRWP